MIQQWIEKIWYQKHPLRWLLWPLSVGYGWGAKLHSLIQRRAETVFNVPVVVVGNLTVGGVGKTPLVVALARHLILEGYRVGIVSRGYKSQCQHYPHEVTLVDRVKKVGDEPLLLCKRTGCPVVIDPNRTRAVSYLLTRHDLDIILSDDGLQHYKMGRSLEIAVVDGKRKFGNGMLLPAGPLREKPARLETVDMVVVNGGQMKGAYEMKLKPGAITNLYSGERILKEQLPQPVAAVAGIGHPKRFFATLRSLGIRYKPYPFADHHAFLPEELRFAEKTVLMTEKDAVKCMPFAMRNFYYLPVEAALDERFWTDFTNRIKELTHVH